VEASLSEANIAMPCPVSYFKGQNAVFGVHFLSIFEKNCPLCGSELPVSAEGCGCGFSFEPNSLEESAQELEIAVQDEQLYSNYLSARAIQTKEAIESAKIVLERDPENFAFQNDLKNAIAEHETASSENTAQTEKLATATKAADAAKDTLEKAKTVIVQHKAEEKAKADALAKQEAEESRLRAVARAEVAREKAAKEESHTKRLAEKQAHLIEKQAQKILEEDEEKQSKQARRAARAAHERQVAMAMALVSRTDDDIKEARKYSSTSKQLESGDNITDAEIDQVATSKKKPVKQIKSSVVVSSAISKKKKTPEQELEAAFHKPVQNKSQSKSNRPPVISKKPDLVFKARQAIKAAAALMRKSDKKQPVAEELSETQSITMQASATVTPIKEKLAKLATPEFKNKQRRDTDRLQALPKLVHNAAPTCPHCTGEIEAGSNQCKCGFVLDESANADGFGLVLSAADKEAMDAFSYISITKMS